jgi:hypothetical protein
MELALAIAVVNGIVQLAPIVYPDIRDRIEDLAKLVPIVLPVIKDAIGRGEDPGTINWDALYGRDAAALQAQVDAQQTPEGHA